MAITETLTHSERRKSGRGLRKHVPRSSHARWDPPPQRPSPVDLITGQDEDRLPALVPYRHERMSESPFAFFRGSARIMASDLASTPVTGLTAQICGDAHLANFGLFGSPERDLVFDLNDFDETLRGPWEWDVKRLAASFIIASRHNGFAPRDAEAAARSSVQYYRDTMAELAGRSALDVWYFHIRSEEIAPFLSEEMKLDRKLSRRLSKRVGKTMAKARTRDSGQALSKLAHQIDGHYQFISDPPFVVPISELVEGLHPDEMREVIESVVNAYRASLPDDRRYLLDRYRLTDVALKVVGVGSVGTRCFAILLESVDPGEPLLLQVKEAGRSVLEEFLGPSPYANQGQRVVEGQRLLQSVSDIFLGWTRSARKGHPTRDYYCRQLRDMKLSARIEEYAPFGMDAYARLCGLTLARAHARSGDATQIAGYVGSGDVFIDSIVEFANAYADQNERDYQEFSTAIVARGLATDDGRSIAR